MKNASGFATETAQTRKARRKAGLTVRSATISLLSVLLISPAFAQEQAKPAEPEKKEEAAPAGPATYVGSETCQGCHEDIYKAFQKNPHAAVEKNNKRGWEGKACESCHGPGSKHAESANAADIRNPAKITPSRSEQVCMTCHVSTSTHIARVQGGHSKNQVACYQCHSVHKDPANMVPRKASAINDKCKSCHAPIWAQFQRPYRHKLPEGSMSCTDCHDPHGTFGKASLKSVHANEEACFKCHAEKRGPFAFEHAPMRLEGCGACHEPHGSANPRMMVRAEVRYLCLECHSNIATPTSVKSGQTVIGTIPPAIHDMRNPRFRNCTVCHQKIHGSYVNRGLFR